MATRFLRALICAPGDHGWTTAGTAVRDDVGYVLPRSEWTAAGPVSPREQDAFRRISAGLAD
jgi:hypothetical protein